jgi:hypothetical protein
VAHFGNEQQVFASGAQGEGKTPLAGHSLAQKADSATRKIVALNRHQIFPSDNVFRRHGDMLNCRKGLSGKTTAILNHTSPSFDGSRQYAVRSHLHFSADSARKLNLPAEMAVRTPRAQKKQHDLPTMLLTCFLSPEERINFCGLVSLELSPAGGSWDCHWLLRWRLSK